MKNKIITIDGPAGAGKSTIAKLLAKQLEMLYLDTGAMYRALAYYFLQNNIQVEDVETVEKVLASLSIDVIYEDGEQKILIDANNVTPFIRTQEIGQAASAFSAIPCVRLFLVEKQRKIGEEQSFVIDGRDIGTFVFPDAKYKFYLTASSNIRAQRRQKQLQEKGIQQDLLELENEIKTRDKNDMEREFAPLKQAEDAILVDSTNYTIEEVVKIMLRNIERIDEEM